MQNNINKKVFLIVASIFQLVSTSSICDPELFLSMNARFNNPDKNIFTSPMVHTFEQKPNDPFRRSKKGGVDGGTSCVVLNKHFMPREGSPEYNLSGAAGMVLNPDWALNNTMCYFPTDGFTYSRDSYGCGKFSKSITSTPPPLPYCSIPSHINATCPASMNEQAYWQQFFSRVQPDNLNVTNWAQCALTTRNNPGMADNIMQTVAANESRYNTWCQGNQKCTPTNNEVLVRPPCSTESQAIAALFFLFQGDLKSMEAAYYEAIETRHNLSNTVFLPIVGINGTGLHRARNPFFCWQPAVGKRLNTAQVIEHERERVNTQLSIS